MGGLGTMQPIGILVFLGVGGVLFDSIAPGAAFALKGVVSLLLVFWLFAVSKAVTQEVSATFTMQWEEDAKKAMMKIPGGVRQGAIEGTEAYAQDQGVEIITAEFCAELRKMMAEAEEG